MACDFDKECYVVVEVYNRTLAKVQLIDRYLTPKTITPFSHFLFQEEPKHCQRLAKLFREGRVSVVVNGVVLDEQQILRLWAYPDTDTTPGPPGSRYFNQPVLGVINGVNVTFSSPTKFNHSPPDTEALYYNGVRLEEGAGNDYIVAESVPATGYDIITMAFAPKAGDKLILDLTPHP
jgi:hypothetical protein